MNSLLISLSFVGAALAFPYGAPTQSCGYGLQQSSNGTYPNQWHNGTQIGFFGGTEVDTSVATIHLAYQHNAGNLTLTVTSSNGTNVGTSPSYVPGAVYNIFVDTKNSAQFALTGGIGGIIIGANYQAGGNGGDIAATGAATIAKTYIMTCVGKGAHLTHSDSILSPLGQNASATWTAPLTPTANSIYLQVGVVFQNCVGPSPDGVCGEMAQVVFTPPAGGNSATTAAPGTHGNDGARVGFPLVLVLALIASIFYL